MHRHLFFTYQSAMSSFLHSVAARLLNEQGDNIGETLVVFNNRRAGLFLQDELTSINKGIFFLPKIIGMDDFIDDLGELNIAPHEFLLFELFDIHRSLDGEDRKFKSFEEFISFGETMVNDFSQIDLSAENISVLSVFSFGINLILLQIVLRDISYKFLDIHSKQIFNLFLWHFKHFGKLLYCMTKAYKVFKHLGFTFRLALCFSFRF